MNNKTLFERGEEPSPSLPPWMWCHCHNVHTNHIHICHICYVCTYQPGHTTCTDYNRYERYKVYHANTFSDIQTLTINEERAFEAFNGNVLFKKYIP